MPAAVPEGELEVLQRKVHGATQERMLREMAEALEVLTVLRPIVVWIEDLHWSDYSTLDLLASVARRRGPARLLVIGTYRPTEVIVSRHPLKDLKQELHLHHHCAEVAVPFLEEPEVRQYLTARFPHHQLPLGLGSMLHESTEGTPLFLVNVIEDLVQQGRIVEAEGAWRLQGKEAEVRAGVPESLRQMIEKQVERLTPEEQRVLEVASVVGREFSAVAVAAGLERTAESVEEECERVVRRGHFLQAVGMETLPDGTIAGRYRFLHALYQSVLYERVAAARRTRLHRCIGEQGEKTYGNRVGEIATELALHFERGQDYARAIQYLGQAAEQAMHRAAYREAIDLLHKGLRLLQTVPPAPEQVRQELALQTTLGACLTAIAGYGAPDVEQAFARVQQLCLQVGDDPHLFSAIFGLALFHGVRAEFSLGREYVGHAVRIAQTCQDRAQLLTADLLSGMMCFYLGEEKEARTHLQRCIATYDPQQHSAHMLDHAQDPGVAGLSYESCLLWLLGYPDQAARRSRDVLVLAERLSHPFSHALALNFAADLAQFRRDAPECLTRAEALIGVAQEQGFSYWAAQGAIVQGWAFAEQGNREEGIAQMCQGLEALQATGTALDLPRYRGLLAEGYEKREQIEEGLKTLADALVIVDHTGERYWEAELYRLKGEFLLRTIPLKAKGKGRKGQEPADGEVQAEQCFQTALKIAQQQQAKSLELRAATSLGRLWQRQGKAKQAHALLAKIYDWFTEGFATKDLQEAKTLIKELSQ